MDPHLELPPYLWNVFPAPWLVDPASWTPREVLVPAAGDSPDPGDTPMAAHLGRKLTAAEVDRAVAHSIDESEALDDAQLARLHVWEVPALVGRELRVDRAAHLLPALAGLITTTLGFPCELPEGFTGALEKYGELEATVPAPPLAAGAAAMALFVVGRITSLDGVDPAADPGVRRAPDYERNGGTWPAVARVTMATYANVTGARVGGAFYL